MNTIVQKVIHIFILLFTCVAFAQVSSSHETFFDTDKHSVTKEEKTKLNGFIASLSKEKVIHIGIYGYCDDRGSDDYNRQLSQRRADAIREIFVSNDFPDTIIKDTDGKGELLLTILDNGNSAAQRKLNRKVEIIVSLRPDVEETSDTTGTNEVDEETNTRYKKFGDVPIIKGDRFLLKNILFKTNYSYIHGKSYKDLKRIAQYLKEHPEIFFKIQGHVCCIDHGRDGIDLKTGRRNLSQARAKFIYDFLADNGVEKKRMRYEGFGSRFPLGGEERDDKRVEILVTYVKKVNPKK